MNCNYCGQHVEIVTGEEIYPHRPDLHSKQFYLCRDCDAYVGCHPNGEPFGLLADFDLRTARIYAHAAFDKTWKGKIERHQAYRWLSQQMGLTSEAAHIGKFTKEQCQEVVRLCNE